MAAETGDNVLIHIPRSGGGFQMRQAGGEELVCRPGDIYVDPTEVTGVARFGAGTASILYVSIPRPLLAGVADANLRRRLGPAPEWRLFRDYVLSLHRELPHLRAEHAARHARHVHDLALLAFGATGDAREIARGRGLRHARLVALKADIDRHLTSERLCLGWLAARHGISERYIRALFADEDMGFNDYVAGQRLALAYRRLTDPASAARSVSQIAFASGFGDISWFNARFRRAFGMTPTEARRLAAGPRS
jgi:AraC-like DNA-binding protein